LTATAAGGASSGGARIFPEIDDGSARREILADTFLGSYLEGVERAASAFRVEPIPLLPFSLFSEFEKSGKRLGFEGPYFERRRRLVALALASWLWRRRADIAALEDAAWAVCDEYAWALPAHLVGEGLGPCVPPAECLDLFACETAFALAEILSILATELSPIVAGRMREETERRVLRPFLARAEPWPWERMRNNWCAVCAGSVGSAALHLVDDPRRLADILARLMGAFDSFMESFPDDGACLEGLGYWTYGVGFLVSFADLLSRATGGRIDFLAHEKIPAVAAFQGRAYLNRSRAISFADGTPDERFRIGLSIFLARTFRGIGLPPPGLAAGLDHDPCGRWCLSFRDLLWARRAAERGEAPSGEAPREASWFPEAQWLLCPAADEASFAFAAKGGHNDEPHNHNDVGSFELVLGERMILADLGAGEYTRDYFGDKRYESFCASSMGHSLPIVDGAGQLPGGERRARTVELVRAGGRGVSLRMDIAAAYGQPSLRRLVRNFEFDGFRSLRIRDEFEFDRCGSRIVERFVTGLSPAELGSLRGSGPYRLEIGADSIVISSSAPGAAASVSVHEHRAHDGRTLQIACIDFAIETDSSRFVAEFEFRLEPRSGSA
jgi:hypothetical protein